MKLNIAYVAVTDFPNGMGSTAQLRTLARGLLSHGHSISIFIPHALIQSKGGLNTQTEGNYEGIYFQYLNHSTARPKSDLHVIICKMLGNLRVAIKLLFAKRPFDAVILYNTSIIDSLFIVTVAKILSCKVIMQFCDERFDDSGEHHQTFYRKIYNYINKLSDRYFPRFADLIFPISEYLLNKYRQHAPQVPIVKIPIVVDAGFFKIKSSYGCACPEKWVVAYTGTLTSHNGIEYLIESISHLKKKKIGVSCLLVGGSTSPEYLAYLHKKVDELSLNDVINFVGMVPFSEMPEYLQRADVLALPQTNNLISQACFPTKLGEYLVTAVPVVTTRFSDIEQYLTHGESAMLCAPCNARDLAEKIYQLWQDSSLRSKIGSNGRRVALSNFDYRAVAKKLVESINTI